MQSEFRQLILDFEGILAEDFGGNFVSMVLYGSVARGSAGKNSDIDVCLIFKEMPWSRYKRNRIIFPSLQKLKGRKSYRVLCRQGFLAEVIPVVYTTEDLTGTPPLFLDMVDEGEIIRDDGTFARKVSEMKKRMAALGSRKIKTTDGHWFWVLKPDLKPGEIFSL